MSTARVNRINRMMSIVQTLYGPDGSIQSLLREVRRGPVRPVDMFPSATVSDQGQRSGSVDAEDSVGLMQTILVTLHVAAEWEKASDQILWEQVVEDIRNAVEADDWPDCAVVKASYVRDDFGEALFLSGKSNAVVEIEFRFEAFDVRGRVDTGDVDTLDPTW